MPSNDDLAKLRQLALAATPGERYLTEHDGAIHAGDSNRLHTIGEVDFGDDDIAFTLAANPTAVLALLDRIVELEHYEVDYRQSQSRLAAANAEVERLNEMLNEILIDEREARHIVSAARDEACDLADRHCWVPSYSVTPMAQTLELQASFVTTDASPLFADKARIAELRKVGT
jgi:hypothetical protein